MREYNSYDAGNIASAGIGFGMTAASMMHETFQKPSFIKLDNKNVNFNNPYLDLSNYRQGMNELDNYEKGKDGMIARNALQMGGSGAALGATIGTAVLPGVGTAIGAVAGGVYGAGIGVATGILGRNKIDERAKNRQIKLDKSLQTSIDGFNSANQFHQQGQAANDRINAMNEQNYLNSLSVYG